MHHLDDGWMPHSWHFSNFWIIVVIVIGFVVWKIYRKNKNNK